MPLLPQPITLEEPAPVRNRALRPDQNDLAILIGKAQRQHLGHELADLARRKIHDRCDLPADECFRRA